MKLLFILLISFNVFATPETNYKRNCVRCHNANPNLKGPIGPDLVTTPLTVLKTKIPKGEYPKGYVPKRKTKIMPKFKQFTEKDIEDLYKYIQSFKK